MKRTLSALALGLAVLPLAACYDDGYSVGMSWQSRPYDVWYDGFYGPIYDGYWGLDGFFYYRLDGRLNRYHRGDNHHFYRGDRAPRPDFRRYQGQTRQPPRGTRMPSYAPHDGGARGRDRN